MEGSASADGPVSGADASSAAAPPRNAGKGADADPGRAFPPAGRDDDRDDDLDDGHFDWLVREMEAGRLLPPPESAIDGPAVSVSLGDACDVDPELLAAVCGPDGLGGQAALAAFGEGRVADVLRPGPVLAALTAQAVARATHQPVAPRSAAQPGFRRAASSCISPPAVARATAGVVPTPGSLTDDELIGALQAARRLENLAAYQQTVVIAEFARRRQVQFEAARAAGRPVGCRDGEFPGEELAMELVASGPYTSGRIDAAIELTGRLPLTLAGMENGTIDLARACAIASRTVSMTDADAAYADAVLAAAAPGLRLDQLARKAEALEKKLAPEAVKARRELAKQLGQRVEARREDSGNACLAGRELDTAEVIASKANIDALAARLRGSGMIGGTLGQLRARVLLDLTQSRNPLDRITPSPATTSPAVGDDQTPGQSADVPTGERCAGDSATDPSGDSAASANSTIQPSGRAPDADGPESAADSPGEPALGGRSGWEGDDELGGAGSLRRDPVRSGDPVPLPALINLLIPAETLLGWSTAPGQAAGWGLLDADESRALVEAAARHPRTRWCFTLTAPDGTAVAHACATGQHPWKPQGSPSRQTQKERRESGGASTSERTAQLADFLRDFNITFESIARDTCDHRHAEDRYVPSRKLKHLLRARNQTCTAPACNAQAIYCDIDHTIPYPDGLTDECNTNPKCRRHHRIKQSPGWNTTQPSPDTTIWTTPAGRTHATTPTVYEL